MEDSAVEAVTQQHLSAFQCKKIDKYDGQRIFVDGQVLYELGNYLGGGASGSVYQAFEADSDNAIAIKILNPLGYKNIVMGQISRCTVVKRGKALTIEQIQGRESFSAENIWWLVPPPGKQQQVFAAYEDPHRLQLRELPLPKCLEIWGLNPLEMESRSDLEVEKMNIGPTYARIDDKSSNLHGKEVNIPRVSPKFLKFLRSRQSVTREMSNMIQIGEHPNIIDLFQVLELVQDTKTTLFLVLELVNGGELFERLRMNASMSSAQCLGGLNITSAHQQSECPIESSHAEDYARNYFKQLLSGIDYCHKKGVVHRDLKPENLLLSDVSDDAILKIADFGLSAVVFASESLHEQDRAPQVLSSDEGSSDASALDAVVPTTPLNLSTPPQLNRRTLTPPKSVGFATTTTVHSVEKYSTKGTFANEGKGQQTSEQSRNKDMSLPPRHSHHRSAYDLRTPQYVPPTPPAANGSQTAPPPHGHKKLTAGVPNELQQLAPVRRLKSVVGSPHYIAPEIASNDPSGYDGRKVDMWSAGIILYSLLTGALPFGGDINTCARYKRYKQWLLKECSSPQYQNISWEQLRTKVAPPQWFLPPSVSHEAGCLLVSLLHCDPARRVSAEEALSSAWCRGITLAQWEAEIKENELSLQQQHPQSPVECVPAIATLSRELSDCSPLVTELDFDCEELLQSNDVISGTVEANRNSPRISQLEGSPKKNCAQRPRVDSVDTLDTVCSELPTDRISEFDGCIVDSIEDNGTRTVKGNDTDRCAPHAEQQEEQQSDNRERNLSAEEQRRQKEVEAELAMLSRIPATANPAPVSSLDAVAVRGTVGREIETPRHHGVDGSVDDVSLMESAAAQVNRIPSLRHAIQRSSAAENKDN